MSDHAAAATQQEPEQRRGVLTGDRACIACGFNLSGQTIVRERHYNMFIVRCPECGVAASLQEYPLLGRWSARLGAAVAGLWVLILLGGTIITAVAIWGFADSIASSLSSNYARLISEAAQEHANAQTKAAGTPPNPYAYNSFDQQWWESIPPDKFFADAGGWARAVHWPALWIIVPQAIVMTAFGIFWSVALGRIRPRLVLAFVALATGLACAFMAIDYANADNTWYWMGGYDIAKNKIGWPLSPIGLITGASALALGMAVGRTLARWLVLLFLPPRLRAPLSFLWITDGLPLPRP